MEILVIGANGAVGRKVIAQLKETGHHSIALVRKEEQVSDLREIGAERVMVGDLEEDFSDAFKDAEGVIFAAGSGGSTGADKTMMVDLWGAKKAVDYANKYHIKRFLQLSATDSLHPEEESEVMKPYAVAKHFSDLYIEDSGLNYTIVHPGPLQDDEGTGKIEVSTELEDDPSSYKIPREDVATVLVNALDTEEVEHKHIFIQSGETPVLEALTGDK